MKRVIPLVAALFLVFGCAVPASAAESDNVVGLEIMDYSTVNGSGSNMFSFYNTTTVNIDVPGSYYCNYIDIVYNKTSGPAPTKVENLWNSVVNELTIMDLGYGYYRAYGTIRVSTYYDVKLRFTTGDSSALTYIEIMSCRLMGSSTHFTTPLHGTFVGGSRGYDLVLDPSVSTPAYCEFEYTGTVDNSGYTLLLKAPNWKQFDFIDMLIWMDVTSVTSVIASCDDVRLPVEVSFLSDATFQSTYLVSIRVDVRGIKRTTTSTPWVEISGVLVMDGWNYIALQECSGFVVSVDHDPLYYYFSGLDSSLTSMFNGLASTIDMNFESLFAVLNPSAPGIGDFKNEASTQAGKMDEITGAVGSVAKPDIGSMDFSVTSFVSESKVISATRPLSVILGNPWFSPIIVASVTLAIASYLLYGKRR